MVIKRNATRWRIGNGIENRGDFRRTDEYTPDALV
jgi:hypothetical protein